MKRIVLSISLMLLVLAAVLGEDIFVAQSAAGGDTGTNLANAHSVTWLNAPGNWGSGAGKISGGDTVHLCGTISSSLTIQGSGSSGSIITILFETGAKLSATHWGTSGALILNSKNYIDIDGGTNGIIESTDNGTALTYHTDDRGILLNNCSNIEIENLTIQNMYIPSGVEQNDYGIAIYYLTGSHLNVHHNTIANGAKILSINYMTGSTDYTFAYNTISGFIVGLTVGSGNTGATLDGLSIHDNTIIMSPNWGGSWSGGTVWHHTDGIHIFAAHTGTSVTNAFIYNNYIGGTNSTYGTGGTETAVTALLYCAGGPGPLNPTIYNNVFETSSGAGQGPGNGLISVRGGMYSKIYNNTFIDRAKGTSIYVYSDMSNVDIKNNIFVSSDYGIFCGGATTMLTSDYNDFYNVSAVGRIGATEYSSLSSWKSKLGGCPGTDNECNSITADPMFVSSSDYHLQATSPCSGIGWNESGTFITDKDGNVRSGSWDIGAYESVGLSSEMSPPTGLRIQGM
jgi:hypothetical protein